MKTKANVNNNSVNIVATSQYVLIYELGVFNPEQSTATFYLAMPVRTIGRWL